MISYVVKADGTQQPFDPNKLNKWAEYATKYGGNWSEIAIETFKRLPEGASTEDIHRIMIQVCLSKETHEYSRIAARLEYAIIRKNILRCGYDDRGSFEALFVFLKTWVWDASVLPDYNPDWELLYEELCDIRMEYWQLKQWSDKYGLKFDENVVETPQMGAMGIALALHGDTQDAYELARNIVRGKINLPTPCLNGCRNGDFDSISCSVITGGDSVDSIGVADHIAYKMTAKKAGIGIEFDTRSKNSPVKGGTITHLGKHPIYGSLDKSVKMFTQLSRGGSATTSFKVIDPELQDILQWKTQKVDIETRIDKMDYSMVYNEAFVKAVINDDMWYLFDLYKYPHIHEAFYKSKNAEQYTEVVAKALSEGAEHGFVAARDILKLFLTARQETGRVYCVNITRANQHTGHIDTIRLSNLCQEIFLPTKPYLDMWDLYKPLSFGRSKGEVAFCALAAINVSRVSPEEYEHIAYNALLTVTRMIQKAPAMTSQMGKDILDRMNVGIGITGLAGYLYSNDMDYDGSTHSLKAVQDLSESHYFWLLKASQRMVQEGLLPPVDGVDFNWVPPDTMVDITKLGYLEHDWEDLRGTPRGHSALVAHMPTESSAVFSDATNGLYPVRDKVVYKKCRKGVIQYLAPRGNYKMAWDTGNSILSKYYGVVQNFSDQGISPDYYVYPERYEKGKVPMSQLMTEWIIHNKCGNKSMYYVHTKPDQGGSFNSFESVDNKIEEDGCTGCTI